MPIKERVVFDLVCDYCGKEMGAGYLSKDAAISAISLLGGKLIERSGWIFCFNCRFY